MGLTKVAVITYFDQMEDELFKRLGDVYRKEATKALAMAKSLAPTGDTGNLKGELQMGYNATFPRVQAWVGIPVGSDSLPYARRVEFGFNWQSNKIREDSMGRVPMQEPKPFLMPSINASRGDIMRAIRRAGEETARIRYSKAVTRVLG